MTMVDFRVTLPEWVHAAAPPGARYPDAEARMRLAIGLARENVERGTGGPFGAAIFECDTGTLVAAGVNRVVPLGSSILHAEVVAILMAQQRVGGYTLSQPGLPRHELVTSCEPCAMCLGALLWSGAKRLVAGATRDDALSIDFDEGPVFPESYVYLERCGIEIVRGVLREDARAVLQLYAARDGEIYNG